MSNSKGKVGRPLGFKLSEFSKKAISDSKRGYKHRQTTRDKISQSLLDYFRRRNPLSEELFGRYRYSDVNGDISNWIDDVRINLDHDQDVLTERNLNNKRRMEISCGSLIELISHSITPELLILFKEQCEINGLDIEEVLDMIEEDL